MTNIITAVMLNVYGFEILWIVRFLQNERGKTDPLQLQFAGPQLLLMMIIWHSNGRCY